MKLRNVSTRPAPHIPAGSSGARSSWRRMTALLLTAALLAPILLLTACGSAEGGAAGGVFDSAGASVASMFLRKTEGTVAVADGEGADVAPAENLGLYSGYTVGTEAESYAWIDLDKVKLAKLNENSAAEIMKDGKNLTIDVTSGSLFFNVTEPLANDETMEISTSSMLVGIRGTCGWAAQKSIGLLEGTVTVTAGDQTATVSAGERAVLTEDGTLEVRELTRDAVPAFVVREVLDDDALKQAVLDSSGLTFPTSYEELLGTEEDVAYSEVIDFEQDGSPELLVIYARELGSGNNMRIYRNGPEGVRRHVTDNVTTNLTLREVYYSLVESNGRFFVCVRTTGSDTTRHSWFYFGSPAEWDGRLGWVDCFTRSEDSVFDHLPEYMVNARIHDERGYLSDMLGWELVDSRKYTLVRDLYSQTFDS